MTDNPLTNGVEELANKILVLTNDEADFIAAQALQLALSLFMAKMSVQNRDHFARSLSKSMSGIVDIADEIADDT